MFLIYFLIQLWKQVLVPICKISWTLLFYCCKYYHSKINFLHLSSSINTSKQKTETRKKNNGVYYTHEQEKITWIFWAKHCTSSITHIDNPLVLFTSVYWSQFSYLFHICMLPVILVEFISPFKLTI